MRFVKVFHPTQPDFVLAIPDEVEDTDLFIDEVVFEKEGWGEVRSTLEQALADQYE